MPVYHFIAFDDRGKRIKGIVDADTVAQARARLRSQGRFPVSIDEAGVDERTMAASWLWRWRGVSRAEITALTRQLATLLGAGIPLVEALEVVLEQTPGLGLKRVVAEIREELSQGRTLSAALTTQGRYFPPLYCHMVRAGEASGKLEEVLDRLAEGRERQEQLQGKVRAALTYPLLMTVFGVVVVVFLLAYVVPGISEIFEQSAMPLPLATRILLAVSEAMRHWWWLLALALLIAVWGIDHLRRRGQGKRLWDRLRLRAPLVGHLLHRLLLARFAASLAVLLQSGVGLLPSLAMVRTLVGNVVVEEALDGAMARVGAGGGLASALGDSPWFPPALLRMIGVGERSGNLETMLEKRAAGYEREVEAALTALTALLEPVLILVMGVIVGFVVLSILLPIFAMNQMVG